MGNKTISKNPDWGRIKHLLKLGLVAAIIATVGDMLLGWGVYDESQSGFAYTLSLYQKVPAWRLLASELLGMFGMFTELLCLFGVYRLMAEKAPKLAHAYRAGILGCSIFGVCGYHVAFVAMFFAYQQVFALAGSKQALAFITQYAGCFVLPSVALFFVFLIVLTIAQIIAFAKGRTPYSKWCWVFSLALGAYIVYVACELIGNYPLTNAVGTAWLHVGAAYMYIGLLAAMPKSEDV